MKTKTKQATKSRGRANPGSSPPRKRMADRGLNEDEQNRRTNVDDEDIDDERNVNLSREDSLENEEERERIRRIEDVRRDEKEY